MQLTVRCRTCPGYLALVALPSKTKLDQLGERLKHGAYSDDDLRLLDSFRRSFAVGYEYVLETITRHVRLEPTGRPAKSTTSIIEKLQRETIRLTQIQDIAGCRVLVAGPVAQESAVGQLAECFEKTTVVERRVLSSHGYRAIHVVATADDKPIEIQVRTALQHIWAEFSEKMADVMDPAIKYGGGPPEIQQLLNDYSELVQQVEAVELMPGPSDQEAMDELKDKIRQLIERAAVDVVKTSGRK